MHTQILKSTILNASTLGVLLLGTAVSLSACGGGGAGGPDRREAGMYVEGLGGVGQMIRPGPSANEAYSQGIDLKKKGDCKAAIERLRPVANLGPGYENAQSALGECLLPSTPNAPTDQVLEAMMWLTRAADGGWTEAQGKLAWVYAVGPAAQRNLDEAAYWLTLYRMNATMARMGFTPMDTSQESAVANAVGPERLRAAAQRAATWQRKAWIPPARTEQPGPERRGMRRGGMGGGPQM